MIIALESLCIMDPEPRFKLVEAVQLRSTKEQGLVISCSLEGGEYWYKVRFTQRVDNVVEDDLEQQSPSGENLESLSAKGQWGMIQAFRSALVVERITNTNQSTVYAFRAQR